MRTPRGRQTSTSRMVSAGWGGDHWWAAGKFRRASPAATASAPPAAAVIDRIDLVSLAAEQLRRASASTISTCCSAAKATGVGGAAAAGRPESATTGIAGGMRKAPKRGHGVRFMWQSGNQLQRALQMPAAKTLGFRTCHSPKSSFPQLHNRLHSLCPTASVHAGTAAEAVRTIATDSRTGLRSETIARPVDTDRGSGCGVSKKGERGPGDPASVEQDAERLVPVRVHHVRQARDLRGLFGEGEDVVPRDRLEREVPAAGHQLLQPGAEALGVGVDADRAERDLADPLAVLLLETPRS